MITSQDDPAAEDGLATAVITIDPTAVTGHIDGAIYGHFLESAFFGNIEGGVFDEGSQLSRSGPGAAAGLRADVIELCRELGTPVVRWPGGNFASGYHWTDGIGPRDRRPRRLDLAWGLEESNRFGTDEFLTWCEEIGARGYLAHSCRDVDEAVRWVEYTRYAGDTELTRQRAANGHPGSYPVDYWGIGNEVYGPWQLGHRPAADYAHAARDHARHVRQVDPVARTVGVGLRRSEEWNAEVLRHAGDQLDLLSIHLYGASTHLVTGDDYDAVVAQGVFFESELVEFSELLAGLRRSLGLERPLSIALDEWDVRHLEPAAWPEPQPAPDGGVVARATAAAGDTPRYRVNRYSPRTLADALCHASAFHAMHRLAGADVPVTMANVVNLVNANGVIVARPGGAARSALFPIMQLYGRELGRRAVRSVVDGPARTAAIRQGHGDQHNPLATRTGVVPDLDVSATLAESRSSVRIAVINRHRSRPVSARLHVRDRREPLVGCAAWDVGATATDPNAVNLIGAEQVTIRDRGVVTLSDGSYTFAPHSVTVLALPLA